LAKKSSKRKKFNHFYSFPSIMNELIPSSSPSCPLPSISGIGEQQRNPSAIVIGAGIIGLTTAVRLLENGWKVRIWTEKTTPYTTSDGAGGIWYPAYTDPNDLNVTRWGLETFEYFQNISNNPETGVTMVSGYDIYQHEKPTPPIWSSSIHDFRWVEHLEDSGISTKNRSFKGAYFCTVPVVVPHVYMRYLMIRFHNLGGTGIVLKTVKSLKEVEVEVGVEVDAIINCSGLAGSDLSGNDDQETLPLSGQIIRVHAPWVRHYSIVEGKDPVYLIPRPDCCVLGGTAILSKDTTVKEEVASRILKDCSELVPGIENAPILSHWVGLRPKRSPIRLELETTSTSTSTSTKPRNVIIHNYGHSGSGVTLCWGCAGDVVKLANRAMMEKVQQSQ